MSVPSWCRVGAKVVCVDGNPRPGSTYSLLPREGQIYTISRVEPCQSWCGGTITGIGIFLLEIDRPACRYGRVYPWLIDRFRPVTETDNDIEARLYRQNAVKRLDRIGRKLNQPERVK